jgi:hypothetical protein
MNIKILILIAIAVIAVFFTFSFIESVPQDFRYHSFVDSRTFWGIPNMLDVLSNIPFIIIGILGIITTSKILKNPEFKASAFQYLIFFSGVFLTGFGSAYYHYAPSNETLIWDRLPIAILSIGFFGTVISEMISSKGSLILVGPLVLIGIGSVLYWYYTESLGRGDLRLYGIVQFLPLVLISLILLMYQLPNNYLPYIIALMIFYALSRIAEAFDHEIFEALRYVSGHTLKHLFAAAGTYCILKMLIRRADFETEKA